MGFKEIMDRIKDKGDERKRMFKEAELQDRIQTLVEERKMSANERELRRFVKEERESSIKEQLDKVRKMRERDISFGHNPLNVKNITSHTEWNVLKEKNQFTNQGNMFANSSSVLKNNKNLLKNNRRLLK